jgi:hypothetical protein
MLLVSGFAVFNGCSRRGNDQQTRQARQQFHVVMESKLRQLDEGIKALGTSSGDSAYASDLHDLEQRRVAMRDQLTAMDAVTDFDQWSVLRDSLEVDYRGMRDQYSMIADRGSKPDTLGTLQGATN